MVAPGAVSLIGSGETSAIGGQVFEHLARSHKPPVRVSVLETPAGFETNAGRVAARVVEYMRVRLQNYQPQVSQVAARKRDTAFSPDAEEIVAPLYDSDIIFFGPGSPTYTVRQLENSLTWHVLQARHRLGTSLALASAATIAVGSLVLPVYEIFKVGEDPVWKRGLDLFQPFGLSLAIVPHWNNREGGDEVDTSRCFIGRERFEILLDQAPRETLVVGIDEHTALTIDYANQSCLVHGIGEVHLIRDRKEQTCKAGCQFPIQDLGAFHPLDHSGAGLPEDIWERVLEQSRRDVSAIANQHKSDAAKRIPKEVLKLADAREEARRQRDWAQADTIRQQINELGWSVRDTPDGQVLERST